jgi:hypothetical protein
MIKLIKRIHPTAASIIAYALGVSLIILLMVGVYLISEHYKTSKHFHYVKAC